MGNNLECRLIGVFGFITLTYFLWMDVMLYYRIQHKDISTKIVYPHVYTPFSDMTMKLIMCDPPNHYLWTPLAQYLVDIFHFTEILPYVSANMITFAHLCVALVSSKFISSDKLYMRRIGVLLFEFRTFLDALDGVVAREYNNKRYQMESEHGTWGYIWDGAADIFGSLFLMIAVALYLYKRFHLNKNYDINYKLIESGSQTENVVNKKIIWSRLLNIALLMLISLTFWDRYITKYHFYIENKFASTNQKILQDEILKSSSMWIIIWFWRLCNAHAFLEICVIAIFIDKIWEFLCWIQYVGYFVLLLLVSITEVHLQYTMKYIGPIIPAQH